MNAAPIAPTWRSALGGNLLLDLRDAADLRFVLEVVADAVLCRLAEASPALVRGACATPPPPLLVYLSDWHECPNGLAALYASLRIEGVEPAARYDYATTDGRRVNYIDVESRGIAQAVVDITAAAAAGPTFVSGAQSIAGPAPHFVLQCWKDAQRKSTKRRPYLCTLHIANSGPALTSLMTQLAPKWWSMHPAYAIVRAARRTTEEPSA